MLLFLALLVHPQDGATPAAPPDAQEDIRVIRRKLHDWRGTIRLGDHARGCITKRSSGDPEIDQIRCDAMTACVPKFEAALKDSVTAASDKATREHTIAEISRRMTVCFEAQHEARIAALAERRAAERIDAAQHP